MCVGSFRFFVIILYTALRCIPCNTPFTYSNISHILMCIILIMLPRYGYFFYYGSIKWNFQVGMFYVLIVAARFSSELNFRWQSYLNLFSTLLQPTSHFYSFLKSWPFVLSGGGGRPKRLSPWNVEKRGCAVRWPQVRRWEAWHRKTKAISSFLSCVDQVSDAFAFRSERWRPNSNHRGLQVSTIWENSLWQSDDCLGPRAQEGDCPGDKLPRMTLPVPFTRWFLLALMISVASYTHVLLVIVMLSLSPSRPPSLAFPHFVASILLRLGGLSLFHPFSPAQYLWSTNLVLICSCWK